MKRFALFTLLFMLLQSGINGQSKGIAEIDKALSDNNIPAAERPLKTYTDECITSGNIDSLVNYIFYTGKIEQKKSTAENAIKRVTAMVAQIQSLTKKPATLRNAWIQAGEYYGSVGKNRMGYDANEKAGILTKQIPNVQPGQMAQVESNMGVYAQRMGDVDLSKTHHQKALQLYTSEAHPDYERLYITYNNMGGIMWYASKNDSALYFFSKALETLKKTPHTPINEFFRPATIQNNLAGIYGAEGKTTEAIKAMKFTIESLKKFLATKDPDPKKAAAVTFQFEATDNLAGIYKELGDMKQARELLEYSYRQKKATLEPDNPAIFVSEILLGQLYYAIKDFDKAETYLQGGLTMISKADGDYLFWQADACNTLALLNDEKKNTEMATVYYEKADSLYEESLQGEYDNIYLEFLRNAALFYAENGQAQKALAKANKGYSYINSTQPGQNLPTFYQLLNLSDVYYNLGMYKEALQESSKALAMVNHVIAKSGSLLDSVQNELKKPKAILLQAKAQYALLLNHNVPALTSILQNLDEALQVLERKKVVINDPQNITVLMADQKDLFDFVKKITLELYQLTSNTSYMDKLMSLQESGVYNRIRSRLDKNESVRFAHLPEKMQATERQLKEAITASLQGNESHNIKMQRYFAAVDNWNRFLQQLKSSYPAYYQMRYASIFKPLTDVQKAIPADATLIRYFFTGDKLYAFVADKQHRTIVPLSVSNLAGLTSQLNKANANTDVISTTLHSLYNQLWAPLKNEVRNKRVIIVPDGVLYSLNFDLLTPTKITSLKQLATNSLLASHAFSYQYSLFLLGAADDKQYNESFVAFAPGFTDDIKGTFKPGLNDPLEKDNTYMSLLPQPFALDLAEKIQGLFGGKAYLKNQSTEQAFKTGAGNHTIIHIGTHAESNNNYPEFSKLIFAKVGKGSQDNELFVHEIYNCDLKAELTVLTACETGKPGYQDGEGMISLAHAFNFAGSQSMLTGLWKIDEQASATLTETFYENLLHGMTKDEALRQAKLHYLQTHDGRMLAPAYWAGLVIMGNPDAIAIKTSGHSTWWIVAGVCILFGVVACAIYLRRKKAALKG